MNRTFCNHRRDRSRHGAAMSKSSKHRAHYRHAPNLVRVYALFRRSLRRSGGRPAHSSNPGNDVYVDGKYAGSDPDPNVAPVADGPGLKRNRDATDERQVNVMATPVAGHHRLACGGVRKQFIRVLRHEPSGGYHMVAPIGEASGLDSKFLSLKSHQHFVTVKTFYFGGRIIGEAVPYHR